GEPRRRDRWRPVQHRLLHALLPAADADLRAGIVDAVGDHRTTVVAPGERDVDLVAAPGAMLARPELPGLRMACRALHVAMADRPGLRQRALAADEGVVLRNRPIGRYPHDLAEVAVQVLGAVALVEPVPQGDEELAVL